MLWLTSITTSSRHATSRTSVICLQMLNQLISNSSRIETNSVTGLSSEICSLPCQITVKKITSARRSTSMIFGLTAVYLATIALCG